MSFTLQILHASDQEAGLEATERAKNFAAIVDKLEDEVTNSISLTSGDLFIPGPFTAAGTDPTVRDEIASFYEQSLGLPPGSLTGIRNGTTGFNVADIAIQNAIGFQAAVLGNHEFDLGPTALAAAFDFTASLPTLPGQPSLSSITNIGAQFPYLSANLDFSGESALSGLFTPELRDASTYATTGAELATGEGIRAEATGRELAPWTTIQEGGETIGVLGVTTQILAAISSVGNVKVQDPAGDGGVDNMDELASILQPLIDQMTASGINKIVLLAHLQQIGNERLLATKLSGVDIILGGGSNTIFADSTDPLDSGDVAGGTYPEFFLGKDGKPVALVNTDGNYNYVGRLVVTFDSNGVLIPDPDGAGALGIGGVNRNVSGAYVTTDAGVDRVAGNGDGVLSDAEKAVIFADGTRGGEVKQITDAIAAVIQAKDGNVFGQTDFFLEGRRNLVRTQETNLGNLTADANLAFAQSVDPTVVISLKNGGGIRAEIGAVVGQPVPEELPPLANPNAGKPSGGISQLDIENSLRFNNALSAVTVTAAQLKEIMEHSVAGVSAGATPGAFPQIGGFAFSFDPTRARRAGTGLGTAGEVITNPGERIRSLALKDDQGNIIDTVVKNGQVVGDPNRTFRLVTLNFLASGGDSYPFAKFAAQNPTLFNRVDFQQVGVKTGDATFADNGTEQDALAEFLLDEFPDASQAFDQKETPNYVDNRIQNLQVNPLDTVLAETSAPTATNALELVKLGTFNTGFFNKGAAEIVAQDKATQRLFVINGADETVDVLDAADPTSIQKLFSIDITPYGASPNSVAVKNGIVAVAIEAEDAQKQGRVAFFDVNGKFLKSVKVGALPDMLTFTPDGTKVLVANEGEPSSYNQPDSVDPVGSVSIIDLSNGVANAKVKTANFNAFNNQRALLESRGIRLFGPNATVAQDLEPEYITVAEDGKTAWVTLQENNALAVLDLTRNQITDIVPLGLKNHNQAGNGLDASDRDNAVNIRQWPISGNFQPDAIASYTVGGRTYLITANEGDTREYDGFVEVQRLRNLVLDPTIFPNRAFLQQDANLGRLNVLVPGGDTDGDGDIDRILIPGGRSFSIWDGATGGLVFDSGDQFEQIIADTAAADGLLRASFNANNNNNNSADTRSDDKGPEPEAAAVGVINGRTYAFIGLERAGGVMVYDVTNPVAPEFVQYINTRDFTVPATLADGSSNPAAGDLGPEGITFISAEDSITGRPLLAIASEISGTTTLVEIRLPESGILDGTSGNDSLVGGNAADVAYGFEGNDTLRGGGANDALFGGVGNDRLRGDGGDDSLVGGTGNDRLEGNNGNDNLLGQEGNDTLNGGGGNDQLDGGAGNDRLEGGNNNDTLVGGAGSDNLLGGSGSDFLVGGQGNDTLTGGSGPDTFVIAAGSGSDLVIDFQDGVDFIGLSGGLTLANLTVSGSMGNTLVRLTSTNELLVTLQGIAPGTVTDSDFVIV
ncbi:MAG: choice-of-anchor I family protein [Gloeomargaritaceae cyanobacterium C42_A2020_066]|nr:choice-of-anchor I family protein [Gloeomargaritaceae cyanobacterium C42_A2020_066]